MRILLALAALLVAAPCPGQGKGNRLTYLDTADPYHVSLSHPRLVTPQWVGDPGVEAVVTLAIDDMNKPSPWVPFLKPAIARLEKIYDGKAPVSIMTTRIDPSLDDWPPLLALGLSIECHTFDHPCPILCRRDFAAAKSTYDRCIEVMHRVPGNRPVAFRVPCCDSRNTPSPRFYAEIFNQTTSAGHYLCIDSSVFNVLTPNDPDLPRELVVDGDGRERFRKYLPFPSFVNTVDDYPYPYVIGRLCWEFPCVTPSDWSAQNLNGPRSPKSFQDLKAALDAVVLKQGTYNLVFHPYGWSHFDQIVELIEHAFTRHGKKVRFLSFADCLERVNRNLLSGQPLRAEDGGDNGVRLLDVDDDGFMDVLIGNDERQVTRIWSPAEQRFRDGELPVRFVSRTASGERRDQGVRFGIVGGRTTMLMRDDARAGAWQFASGRWVAAPELLSGLALGAEPVHTAAAGRDLGVRLRDLDRDGQCELIVGNPAQRGVFAFDAGARRWRRLAFTLPALTRFVDAAGRDAGLRFCDVDEDGFDDVVFSNEQRYSLHLFHSIGEGWSTEVRSAPREGPGSEPDPLPMISRSGTDNGAFFHSRHLWVQNEDTAHLQDLVDRRSFNELLATVEPAARTPEASRASIRAHPGFRVELAAAEPLIADPVAIEWSVDGRLWVVEMGGYPDGPAAGRVRWLEDTDGDGRYDRSKVFAADLAFPTGVMPWRDGCLITCAPDVLYAADTDGDGVADRREVLFTGFVEGNQQHRVNGLRWGLDNWIHCANGDSGGVIRSILSGKQVDIGGRDLRIRPDTGDLDPETGMTQFGRCRDDWGNWFGGNSGRTLWHCVLQDHYLRRNPALAPPSPRVDVMTPAAFAPVFPISRAQPRFNDPQTANRFTSACGAGIYRDELFGPHFAGAYFICEPVHNLVHLGRMVPRGVTFAGERPPGTGKSEFLAAGDNWFRPVQARTGPDGALWIVDMYRRVIEHPRWIPEEWQERLDLRAGQDRGRIYRVVPVAGTTRRMPKIRPGDVGALAGELRSPNGPRRDMAQRRLVAAGRQVDPETRGSIGSIVTGDSRAACRIQALCTLDGLGDLGDRLLLRALADDHPAVRRQGVRLAESRLDHSPVLQAAVLALATTPDPDPAVRLQLACSLGEWHDPRAARALAGLAGEDRRDPIAVAAVLSSATPHGAAILHEIRRRRDGRDDRRLPDDTWVPLVRELVVLAARAGDEPALTAGLELLATAAGEAPWRFAVLADTLDALGRRGRSLADLAGEGHGAGLPAAVRATGGIFADARRLAVAASAPVPTRIAAIRLLSRGPGDRDEDARTLAGLLGPRSPGEIQLAAAEALGALDRQDVPALLLAGLAGHGPALRARILDLLLRREAWALALLDRMAGTGVAGIPPGTLSLHHRQQLTAHPAAAVRSRAAQVFAAADPAAAVVAARAALELRGDPVRGGRHFATHCSTCHRLGGQGSDVGPDLRALTDRTPAALLEAIVDPNRAVEPRYLAYTARTRDGRSFAGILASETGNSVTLVGPTGARQVFLRTELAELTSTGLSLMPPGYGDLLKSQDLADLIAYIARPQPPGKVVPRAKK